MSGALEITPVREGHEFDEGNLYDFMAANVEGFSGDLLVEQFEGGQSNPTFFLTAGDKNYVLRKQPPGDLVPSAHAVDREFRVIQALQSTDVPVPKVFAASDDLDIIGTKFYIMDYITGRIFRDPNLPELEKSQRRGIYEEMMDVLARLHKVDHEAVGLGDYGKAGNYFERQIGRWTRQYKAAESDTVEVMDNLIAWLPENIPADDTTGIAHGDYRLENAIFHPTEPKMIALLDWELSTLGHPLADLAYNGMTYHIETTLHPTLRDTDLEAQGIPTLEENVRNYARASGRGDTIENWDFYMAFSLFRMASIRFGIYQRFLQGNASNPAAEMVGQSAPGVATVAWNMVKHRA